MSSSSVVASIANAEIRSIPVGELHEHPKNPNRRKDVTDIVESIRANGFYGTLVAQRSTMRVLKGNHTFRAAKAVGLAEVPVALVDVDDATATRILLVDNRAAERGEREDVVLAELLQSLSGGLDGTGYTPKDLDRLLAELSPNLKVGDAVEPGVLGKKAISTPGHRYQLGPNVLVCGDSTRDEAWASLLDDGRPIDMVWTDPPYGVSYVGGTKDALQIQNDSLSPAEMESFLEAVLRNLLPFKGAAVYVAAPAGPLGVPFANVLLHLGMFRQRLVWLKDRFVLGHSDYHYRHEDIYFGYVPGADGRRGRGGDGWFSDNSQDSVFEVPRPNANREHPTMKPIELVERHIENSSRPGWVVADPFGGSGTTLIAAARTGRVARIVELDPLYADVIRRRWTAWANSAGIDPGPDALD